MNGVEILSSTTYYNTILPAWCFFVGLAGAIAFAIIFSLCLVDNRGRLATITGLIMIVLTTISCLGIIKNSADIAYIEYKVTIDDSVSMTEFMDKYEIIDQEGKIYTVKERE